MIKTICKTVKEFISIKDKCIFCYKPLTPLLSNTINGQDFNNSISDIRSAIQNDQFKFKLKYDGESVNFNVSAFIDIKNNRFGFYHNQSSQNVSDKEIKDFFLRMSPHITLACENKKCGTKYFLQSYPLYINYDDNFVDIMFLAMEAFRTNKLYIINYYHPTYP